MAFSNLATIYNRLHNKALGDQGCGLPASTSIALESCGV